ncbi:hypothetical protein HDR59_02900 [bacterium]|nr:hypothetical protein [bacterium]
MDTTKTNNKKIKYLTYKDVLKRLQKLKNKKYTYKLITHREYINSSEIYNVFNTEMLIGELMSLPEDCVNLIEKFINLTDYIEDHQILLDRLIVIYKSILVNHSIHGDILYRDINKKTELLKKTFNIFQNLKDRDVFLHNIIYKEKKHKLDLNLVYLLLNEKFLLYILLKETNFIKDSNEYEQIKNKFFSNVGNGR